MLVVDASVVMGWTMPDETSPFADAAFREIESGGLVPSHWPAEVTNALRSAERSGRLDSAGVSTRFRALATLDIEVDDAPWGACLVRALDFSRRLGLTVYDAAYLELAVRREVRLATLDRQLATLLTTPEFAHLRFESKAA